MSNRAGQRSSNAQRSSSGDLDPDSYTAIRLHHATPQHLYLTTRRLFIGPIPEGWLKSHRKSWYKHHLRLSNYSSRQATFRAGHDLTWTRRTSGLEHDPTSAGRKPQQHFRQSFPQPSELDGEDAGTGEEQEPRAQADVQLDGVAESRLDDGEGVELEEQSEDADAEEVTTNAPPAIEVPRAAEPDEAVPESSRSKGPEEEIREEAKPLDEEAVGQPSVSSTLKPPDRSDTRHTSRSTRAGYATAKEGQTSREVGPSSNDPTAPSPESGSPDVSANEQSLADNRTSLVASSRLSDRPDPSTSTSALIPSVGTRRSTLEEQRSGSSAKKMLDKVKSSMGRTPGTSLEPAEDLENGTSEPRLDPSRRISRVHFSPEDNRLLDKVRTAQMALRRGSLGLLKRKATDGQIIKMEKMLIRVDATLEKKLPTDYDENSSQAVVSRVEDRWREYMVVCRQSTTSSDAEFTLLIYKTRVIRAVDNSEHKKHATHVIPLGKKVAGVNLYSALDKTVVIWAPGRRETKIYILRPRSSANAVEWYTFLRNVLGWHRPSGLQVNVPDLGLQLRIANPFEEIEALRDAQEEADDGDDVAKEALQKEQRIADQIIKKCLRMLEASPHYKDVVTAWSKEERMGLAWKRYDRLEWIHGDHERKMYGTMAMMKSHELELRPKEHYPTTALTKKGNRLTEPPPVEGFLIRLTSQKGRHQRFGKLFFKRLYFSTFDHYLVFSRPARADPPPPPKIPSTENGRIPNAHQISNKIPIIYAVNPYPVENGEITWLFPGRRKSAEEIRHRDQDAYDETARKASILQNCDGFIDLCNVVKVRNFHKGESVADDNVDEGSDVDFDLEVTDTREDDGATTAINENKTFEIVLNNGLVIRLQAFDQATKQEWKKRVGELVKYWKYRHAEDIELYKAVRRQNLESLRIDEETEALVGQFARKWEVTQTYASPELFNMCGISCCRIIHISGPLYRKPRRRSLFTSTHCMLAPGRMLVFSSTLRTRTGKSIPHIHHEKIDSIDLTDCYLYSGLVTENDLLYQNRTFDANNPGHHALPRMWLEDSWTSQDEDTMTCFVVWRPLSKSWFRRPSADQDDTESGGEGKKKGLARVSQLGVKGRTVVFKARSRAERDHWVLGIAAEIERLQGGEDVRLVAVKKGEKGKKNDKSST